MHISRKQRIGTIFVVFSLAAGLFLLTGFSGSYDVTWQDHQASIPILMYHSISDTPIGIPELSVTTKAFDEQMSYLSSHGYTPIDFNEIGQCSQEQKPVIITFDDGYSDNATNAYPILKKYGMKATVFVITKTIGTPGYLSREQMAQMSDLVSFQSHTVNHKRLNRLNRRQIRYECAESQKTLSEITGKPVYVLSYPNGKFNANVTRISSRYYQYGVTTFQGLNTLQTGRYKLKRSAVSRADSLSVFISRL
ncbi:MAG: polysaccharide deacetylase family protein [Intestinimonas sp.]|nr:polysaccharide deacetylase family protein [Intestinimonas sp.]